ncbi:MAG: hypothetical protein DLM70_00050 [Chloroflexi bacterium]|nr:MAG: hypothetical protein DLM70_00050 [Chloroflexota bacterium]
MTDQVWWHHHLLEAAPYAGFHTPPRRPDHWQQLQLLTDWPEQFAYELIRPVVLFGEAMVQRAEETRTSESTIRRKVTRFDATDMASLFSERLRDEQPDKRELPGAMRQLLVDLRADYPAFRLNELATICYVMTGRRPSSHTVQRVLGSHLPPQRLTRRYPLYAEMEPGEGRQAIVQLPLRTTFSSRR